MRVKLLALCLALAFTRICWPDDASSDVTPLDVAHAIFHGHVRGFDGPPPRNPAQIAGRARRTDRIWALKNQIGSALEKRLEGLDMYSLRKTHISWARRLVSPDSVRAQVGHAADDAEGRHYLDLRLVDAAASAEAVWRTLEEETVDGRGESARLAAGAENFQLVVPVVAPKGSSNRNAVRHDRGKPLRGNGAGEGARTLDFDLGKVALYH